MEKKISRKKCLDVSSPLNLQTMFPREFKTSPSGTEVARCSATLASLQSASETMNGEPKS